MALEARGVSFSYPCGRALLERVSLRVEPGERVALTGPSGRGKTTLCRILAGYLEPGEGAVLVDGVSLPDIRRGTRPLGSRADQPGIHSNGGRADASGPLPVQLVWQHPEQAMDPLLRIWRSLSEAAPDARRQHDVAEALDAGGLSDALGIRAEWLDRFPHELSGGELMRLCIARALMARPRYLIFDEATSMLDAITQAEIWRALIGCADARGMGLVVVSHSPALISRVATRCVDLGPLEE